MNESILKRFTDFVPPTLDWDCLEDPVKRIKRLSVKYKDVSIAESFRREYDLPLETEGLEDHLDAVTPLAVGDNIDVTVDTVTKDKIYVSRNHSKDYISLRQGPTILRVEPGDKLTVSVVEKRKDEVIADALQPLIDEWLDGIQRTLFNRFQSSEVVVRDLQLVYGGYTGKILVEGLMFKKPYYVNAFIPGSQIVLNIEQDFDRWVGKNVTAMVTAVTKKNGALSVICSRKKYLNSLGGQSLVNIFDMGYGTDNHPFTNIIFEGHVTGILNSANKQGVFVEVPMYNITGMIPMSPAELVNYRLGDALNVIIDRLDWEQTREPYIRNRDGVLTEVNLKPVFRQVSESANA